MFNISRSNVFIEIGQAIGNVGEGLLRRGKSRGELVNSILKRRLSEASLLAAPSSDEELVDGEEEVIDAVYRVLTE